MKTTKSKIRCGGMFAFLALALALTMQVANADYTFGEPTNLGATVNSVDREFGPSVSADGLSLYFDSTRPGGYGDKDLWITTRVTREDPWGEPVNLGSTVNSAHADCVPSITAYGLSLFFHSDRPEGFGERDIWLTTRPTINDPWGEPVNLGPPVNTSYRESGPCIAADGLTLYFVSVRPGGYGYSDIWVAMRPTTDDDWDEPINLGPTINTSSLDLATSSSADDLMLFLGSSRSGGAGSIDIWMSRRPTKEHAWGTLVNLGPTVNSPNDDFQPRISPNGRTLYFNSNRPGGFGGHDIYQVPIIPIVDLNGDGIVDAADMCVIVDHWGEDYSLCDIGPMPWGDGIVDAQDLIVLAVHLFEEVNDPTLVAHWALDEAEGDIASDSANDNDGTVYGDPAWQPQGGMLDGALQLDGIDDYVSTPFVLNPADGKFSVFAWIKGGAPGQAVVSQMGGARWLCADPSEGNLMTELKASGRGSAELLSQTVITDGNWHRIGLVWDGSNRTLYVDDIAVAEDEQANLEGSDNGLYIGTGTAMEPGSFWSGLIDDVRIYNRAVTP